MQGVIINYYPPVIKKIKEIQQIAKAEDAEFEKLKASTDEVLKNMYVLTANEMGIKRFEKIFRITPPASQSLEDRKLYVLSVINRGKMSLFELRQIISSYSQEIKLVMNYDESELMVNIGENVKNTSMVFKILDEILPIQVCVFFAMKIIFAMRFTELPLQINLKTSMELPICRQSLEMIFETTFAIGSGKQAEEVTFELVEKKHLRYFDGTTRFDGSGGLFDAEIKREVL